MKDLILRAIQMGDEKSIQHLTKIIAIAVRNEMEDFHVSHLTDEQMKELNPIIRRGIYSMLLSFAHSDKNEVARNNIRSASRLIPDYWENSKTNDFAIEVPEVKIKSEFLNEQRKVGNITFYPELGAIEISASYDLVGDANVKNLKAKIRNHLKKEDFYFNSTTDLYFKKFLNSPDS